MRRRGTVLVLLMVALAAIGIVAGVIASRFAALGQSRARNDVRVQLRWAARTAAATGAQGRAVVDGRAITVEASGGAIVARHGQSRVTMSKTASGWTERHEP